MLTRMDEFGRPAWVLATVLGFWMFWPVGLAILGYLAWTGRLKTMVKAGAAAGMGRAGTPGQWFNLRSEAGPAPGGSGNKAFDDYRAETLRRLEEEQREFVDYLDRLRRARDKAEFDGFMAERRHPVATQDDTQRV